jgi:hypothetical protein
MGFWKKLVAGICAGLLGATALISQQDAKQQGSPQQQSTVPAKPNAPAATPGNTTDFLHTTDEVLADMSKLLGMPLKEPLKKSLRSRDEIRAYVIKAENEDETPEERYADQKEMEKLGLIPKGFPLDSFMVDLLTEQIAGLYDSKTKEFYIADWIEPEDQREVMAHELTHALQDQYYNLDKWRDAAKPDEDAELARDSVLEGSAVVAMLDYTLQQQGMSVESLGNINISGLLGELDNSSPLMAKAPQFIRDDLTFPYGPGADFTQHVLQLRGGWPAMHTLFDNPPVSTQQIMHPELYMHNVKPEKVQIPDLGKKLGPKWKKLDENVLGEFGLVEVLKEFVEPKRAEDLAATWDGDRYAVYEQQDSHQVLLVVRVHAGADDQAARLFGGLSEAYEKKYATRTNLMRRPNYFSFDTDEGPVFLRCVGSDCLTFEGADRSTYDELTRAMGWPASPGTAPSDADAKRSKAARTSPQPRPMAVSAR